MPCDTTLTIKSMQKKGGREMRFYRDTKKTVDLRFIFVRTLRERKSVCALFSYGAGVGCIDRHSVAPDIGKSFPCELNAVASSASFNMNKCQYFYLSRSKPTRYTRAPKDLYDE